MKEIIYKHKIWLSIALAIIVLLGLFSFIILNTNYSKKENPYPILAIPPNMTMHTPQNLEELCGSADSVFLGTVLEEIEIVEKWVEYEKGSQDYISAQKTGKTGNMITSGRVKVKVDKVFKGNLTADEEVYVLSAGELIDYQPKFKDNMQMLFVSNYNSFGDGYVVVHPHAGYYYITDNKKVYPADHHEYFKNYNGMSVKKFEKELENVIE